MARQMLNRCIVFLCLIVIISFSSSSSYFAPSFLSCAVVFVTKLLASRPRNGPVPLLPAQRHVYSAALPALLCCSWRLSHNPAVALLFVNFNVILFSKLVISATVRVYRYIVELGLVIRTIIPKRPRPSQHQ